MGSKFNCSQVPGVYTPGFMLAPALQAKADSEAEPDLRVDAPIVRSAAAAKTTKSTRRS